MSTYSYDVHLTSPISSGQYYKNMPQPTNPALMSNVNKTIISDCHVSDQEEAEEERKALHQKLKLHLKSIFLHFCEKLTAKIRHHLNLDTTIFGSNYDTRTNNDSKHVKITYNTRGGQGFLIKLPVKLSRFKIRTLLPQDPPEDPDVVVKDQSKQ